MTRPEFNEAMALELAKSTAKYLNVEDPEEYDLERIAKVLNRHWRDNGFELGKEFEDEGYSIDADVVSYLDCVNSDGDDILTTHIKEWVKSENITLDLKPGDSVELKRAIQGERRGVIYDLRPATAQYGVRIEKIMKSPTSRYIINCEDLTHIPANSEPDDERSVANQAQ